MAKCAGSYAVEEAATMCNWFHTVHHTIPACEIRVILCGLYTAVRKMAMWIKGPCGLNIDYGCE